MPEFEAVVEGPFAETRIVNAENIEEAKQKATNNEYEEVLSTEPINTLRVTSIKKVEESLSVQRRKKIQQED